MVILCGFVLTTLLLFLTRTLGFELDTFPLDDCLRFTQLFLNA